MHIKYINYFSNFIGVTPIFGQIPEGGTHRFDHQLRVECET